MSTAFQEDNCQSLWMANLILTHTHMHTWKAGINTPASLLPFVKLLIFQSMQTYTSNTKPLLGVSHPNHATEPLSRGWWDVHPPAWKMPHVPTSHPPYCPLTQAQPTTYFHPIYYSILLPIRNWTKKNNSGAPWSWGPDPIVFCKSKKDQLSMAQICIPTPESVVTHTHKKPRSVLRNNLPSQPSCDDVSFLITNCLFMLQQLPRAANKWLKECLDQAFRPLLSGGCYLVDSDGSSCLVWKGAEMARPWLTEGPWGQPDGPTSLYSRLQRESQGPAWRLEVKGNVGG